MWPYSLTCNVLVIMKYYCLSKGGCFPWHLGRVSETINTIYLKKKYIYILQLFVLTPSSKFQSESRRSII